MNGVWNVSVPKQTGTVACPCTVSGDPSSYTHKFLASPRLNVGTAAATTAMAVPLFQLYTCIIERQLDSLSRAVHASSLPRPCINAYARVCAKIRREVYTGYTGQGNTLERMQHATRLSLQLRDIARCAPPGLGNTLERTSSMRMSRSHAFRRAVYDFCFVPLLETSLRR